MKKYRSFVFGLAMLCSMAWALNMAQAADPAAWRKRCEGQNCEIMQRLMDQQSGTRMLEVAIGFPDGRERERGRARGVFILPLGIDMQEPLRLQIDDQAPVNFKVRYCLQDGCYAFLDISATLLDQMKGGALGVLSFRTFDGQPARLPLALEGFSAGIAALQP